MDTEHKTSDIIGATNCRDDNIPLVVGVGPVHDMILTIDRQEQPMQIHLWEHPLIVGGESQTLTVNEVDLAIECVHADLRNFIDSPERHLVDQEVEDVGVPIREPLPCCRGPVNGEGLSARGSGSVSLPHK